MVPTDDVDDRIGLNPTFRPFGVVLDAEAKQGVYEFVDQRPGRIGIVLPVANLNERLNVNEGQLLADALRLAVGLLRFEDGANRDAEFVGGTGQPSNEIADGCVVEDAAVDGVELGLVEIEAVQLVGDA